VLHKREFFASLLERGLERLLAATRPPHAEGVSGRYQQCRDEKEPPGYQLRIFLQISGAIGANSCFVRQ
jgi:hypothetical protein